MQGRLPYFIDEYQRALNRADAGVLRDKSASIWYTIAETRCSTTLGMQCESSFGVFKTPAIAKLLQEQKMLL